MTVRRNFGTALNAEGCGRRYIAIHCSIGSLLQVLLDEAGTEVNVDLYQR